MTIDSPALARIGLYQQDGALGPGPTAVPFIGNVAHMRLPELWKAHQRLSDSYGDVPVLGQSVMILGSPIFDLLDRLTSDRLQSPLIPLTYTSNANLLSSSYASS
ncbi:hypothetical protein C8Q74DRAFT_1273676 [Fomes fomentarius]|nr:hypothetical protein C8Q74DRAFT_1273676 [Fomes fomentarius]